MYDYRTETLSNILLLETNNPVIYCLEKDQDGFVWVGTNFGVFILDQEQHIVMRLKSSKVEAIRELSSDAVYSMKSDGKENMWIGTDLGLNLYNKSSNNFLFT